MKKTWIALLLALCMMTALGAASACCTSPSGMDETQTMEETCPCMMDGKGADGCPCMDGKSCVKDGMCGKDCLCMDGKSCMQDGMCAEDCMCEKQCACENECACAEKKLEMLTTEMNAVFEKNMDLWNRFFGMMDKQPDMDMSYADYLAEQLEMMKENFTEDEYKLLQQDITDSITLDSPLMEAYKGATGTNGCMSGDFPTLLPGQNAISWTGNVTKVVIQPNWRYLV